MTATTSPEPLPEVYTGTEVAALFRVHPRVVTRWAAEGKFGQGAVFRTPGGHLRYHADKIRAMLAGDSR
jgi:hypothetical protein